GDAAAMCLACGATMDLQADAIVPGASMPGGPPDPAALARPARGGRGAARPGGVRTRTGRAGGGRRTNGRSREAGSAPGA
ncbi:MAG: hypothetical protein ABI628_10310, partial [Chloroflexota bacterium]